jgi:ABC-type glycerol-3-phosphate transport system permease component
VSQTVALRRVETVRSPLALARRRGGRALLHATTIVLGAGLMLPFVYAVSSSLKPATEVRLLPPVFWPANPQWDNYLEVWRTSFYGSWVANSVLIGVLATAGTVLSAAAAGYAFARFDFPWRRPLFAMTLATMMLPYEVTLIPSYLLFFKLGWLNTFYPLIVPAWLGGGAFYIFLFRQFFMTIPRELDEAAKIDGASHLQILAFVVMPLSLPVVATAAILAFISHWNAFIFPLIILNDTKKFTLSIGLRYFAISLNGTDQLHILDHLLLAGALIMTLPIVVIFFLGQRYFVRGVVMSGIKG